MQKLVTIILALLCLFIVQTNGQEQDAKVKRVIAVTANGLIFSAWIARQTIRSEHDIVVNYKVENRSGKSIYLVHDNTSDVTFEDAKTIIFPEPLVVLGGHEPCDYKFTKVGRGKSYQAHLVVAADNYRENTRYAKQVWSIQVGLGYVTNIKGLRVQQFGDPSPCKGLLNSRLKTLSLGELIVEVSKL